MTPYATVDDVKARYPAKDLRELTDEAGETINDSLIAVALGDASVVVDGYLNGRYALPLVSVPANLVVHTCAIAMYLLQALRPNVSVEDVRKRYEDAIKYFEQV